MTLEEEAGLSREPFHHLQRSMCFHLASGWQLGYSRPTLWTTDCDHPYRRTGCSCDGGNYTAPDGGRSVICRSIGKVPPLHAASSVGGRWRLYQSEDPPGNRSFYAGASPAISPTWNMSENSSVLCLRSEKGGNTKMSPARFGQAEVKATESERFLLRVISWHELVYSQQLKKSTR